MGMMNLGGSLRYDMHGRKRKNYKKNNPTKRINTTKAGIPAVTRPVTNETLEQHKEHLRKYPSMPMGKSKADGKGTKNMSWDKERQEISKGYTVAPAYNKGAYQVIGKNNIKDIGR